MKWKVISTHFGKLESALNRLEAGGFTLWQLVVLAPESTRTRRFVVIVVASSRGHRMQALLGPPPDSAPESYVEAGTQGEVRGNSELRMRYQREDNPKSNSNSAGANESAIDKNFRLRRWEGKLIDPEFSPNRRTGRFEIKDR
jgi:hypothetical protein